MQEDFHYYATFCAAYLAGFSHEDSTTIAYSSQFVDDCSKTLIEKLKGPVSATTTQLQAELVNVRADIVGLQDITRIWTSFHFLPFDLYAKTKNKRPKIYMNKYRLLCKPNGSLVVDTLKLAKDKSLQAYGIAMHVLADTWAHSYFVGTPSNVINNTDNHFFEITSDGEKRINFKHNPSASDDLEKGIYSNSLHQENENSIMNLGHGRAGHLPDYSFIKYKYLPAWAEYEEIIKDNPTEYYNAFCQMVYALLYLKGDIEEFALNTYATSIVEPHRAVIQDILKKRQLIASADWKAFGEKISGKSIEAYDTTKYQREYQESKKEEKDKTFLGKFFIAAMAQKSMVTGKIFKSGNSLAGFSKDYIKGKFSGIKDFKSIIGD